MPTPNAVITVIREWVVKAENDLKTAAHTLTLGDALDGEVEDRLTRYATVLRYPGAGPDVPLTEARKAVAIARRVRREVRTHLPRAVLRRERK
jgi:HEPN domain-containing protein